MQCAVIEFARNVLGWKDAHTTEIADDCKYPVISMMEEQKESPKKVEPCVWGRIAVNY